MIFGNYINGTKPIDNDGDDPIITDDLVEKR